MFTILFQLNGLILSIGDFSPYLPFFMSASTLIVLLVYLALVCPESLQKDDTRLVEEDMTGIRRKTLPDTIKSYLSLFVSGLLSPISMFAPRNVVLPTFRGRDWNLTLVGAALFIYLVSIVSLRWVIEIFNLTPCFKGDISREIPLRPTYLCLENQ